MEFAEPRIVLPTRNTPWRLYPLGDIHFGAEACDKDAFREKVQEIAADPHGYWIGMGDYIDGIGYHDKKRFDPDTLDKEFTIGQLTDIFNVEAAMFLKAVAPIKHKCLGMLCGNHEESIRIHSHTDPGLSMANHMGVPDLRYSAAITIKVYDEHGQEAKRHPSDEVPYKRSRYTVRVYGHHGWGGGRTDGGKVQKVTRDMLDIAPADTHIFLMGHVHVEAAIPRGRMRFAGRDFNKPSVFGTLHVITGTYMRNWITGGTTYSEKSGMGMVHIGSPTVEIKLAHKNKPIDDHITERYEQLEYRILGSWVGAVTDTEEE